MPTPDQSRIERDRANPRIMELHRALQPLKSVVRFMQTGAHPDDEISGMLAAISIRDGINLSYACSTRGEGGQNDIGSEAGGDLGALRTREMERACDVLNMRLYWHGETASDPITDFGFSKSGTETLKKWGYDRTLARFVDIVRTDRPDILCPTFLDVPGQHGHHRAMTQAAHDVMKAAADPDFATALPPWKVAKLYLPAWSGAGQAYDDDLPPPPATLTVDGSGRDPVSGWSWQRIGQQSRAYHRTQGMGRWSPAGEFRDWPLHLASSHAPGPDEALWSGLPLTLEDLADLPGLGPIALDLRAAQAAILMAINTFPDFDSVARAAATALSAVKRAADGCPEPVRDQVLHRLHDKQSQLGHVLRLALGIEARARTDATFLTPGESTRLVIECDPGEAGGVSTDLDLPTGWSVSGEELKISKDAKPTSPYRTRYDPTLPDGPALRIEFTAGSEPLSVSLPFDPEPVVLPSPTTTVQPQAAVLNLAQPGRHVSLSFRDIQPMGATAELDLPDGWVSNTNDGTTLTLPDDPEEALYRLPVRVGGQIANSIRRIHYPHVAPTAQWSPAELRLRVLRAKIPDVRVGYIGAGNDRVGYWLSAMGVDVTDITDEMLGDQSALAAFDTIVIGIFAMRFRAGLSQAMPALHRWTEAGGTLVTLYHRPWDNWDPDEVPPRRLEIGQPSLRWRVTDEAAKVRHLADHPLLTTPNRIGAEDWENWVKERVSISPGPGTMHTFRCWRWPTPMKRRTVAPFWRRILARDATCTPR